MNALQRTIKYPQSIPGDIASALSDLRSGVYDEIMAASAGGICSISVTTMKSMSALKGIILLSDLLTDDKPFYLPTESRQYRIINNWTTTTSKVVTATTRNGNGVVMGPGDICDVYCDGTNIVPIRITTRNVIIVSGTPAIPLTSYSNIKITGLSASGDILNQWSTANQRFVAKNTGVLSVFFQGLFASASGQLYENHQCMIRKNGDIVAPPSSVFIDGHAGSAYNAWPLATFNMPVVAGDYLEFYCLSALSVNTQLASFTTRILQIS